MNILYFDDDCIICNGFARRITRLDRKGRIHFQSVKALDGKIPDDIDSLVYESDKLHLYSDAFIEVMADATGFRPIRLLKVVPKTLRNAVYKFIARNRYRWSKNQSCSIDPEVRSRIVDMEDTARRDD